MKSSEEILASFNQFCLLLGASNEIGLIIASDDEELNILIQLLDHSNFQLADTINDLMMPTNSYKVIDSDMDKEVYDFAVQYPLGRIEVLDNNMQIRVLSPDYSKQCIVFLVKNNNLKSISEKGFDLRSVTGPAFRI